MIHFDCPVVHFSAFHPARDSKMEAFSRHIVGVAAEAAGLHVEHPTLLDELEKDLQGPEDPTGGAVPVMDAISLPVVYTAPAAGTPPDAGTNDLSAQMQRVAAQMDRLQRLPEMSVSPPMPAPPTIGVRHLSHFFPRITRLCTPDATHSARASLTPQIKRLVTWQSLLVPELCAAPESLPLVQLVIDVGPRDPGEGPLREARAAH